MLDDAFEDYPIPAPAYSDEDDSDIHTGPWWDWYQGYIKSKYWAARRRALLQQADSICVGCKSAPATDAHHRTYQNVGCEPLSDLEALCAACHDERHGVFSAEIGLLAAEALVLLSQEDSDDPIRRAFLN